MIKKLNEAEFIEMFSLDFYNRVAETVLENIINTPEFKNDKPYSHHLCVLPCSLGKEKFSLTIEANCNKLGKGVCDLGIISMTLSDEEMPDVALDRYNELMKENL